MMNYSTYLEAVGFLLRIRPRAQSHHRTFDKVPTFPRQSSLREMVCEEKFFRHTLELTVVVEPQRHDACWARSFPGEVLAHPQSS